jgi:hypothetical protein
VKGITFQAILSKASTTVDGGWVVSFAVSQDEAQAVLQLTELRDDLLQLAVVPVDERVSRGDGI